MSEMTSLEVEFHIQAGAGNIVKYDLRFEEEEEEEEQEQEEEEEEERTREGGSTLVHARVVPEKMTVMGWRNTGQWRPPGWDTILENNITLSEVTIGDLRRYLMEIMELDPIEGFSGIAPKTKLVLPPSDESKVSAGTKLVADEEMVVPLIVDNDIPLVRGLVHRLNLFVWAERETGAELDRIDEHPNASVRYPAMKPQGNWNRDAETIATDALETIHGTIDYEQFEGDKQGIIDKLANDTTIHREAITANRGGFEFFKSLPLLGPSRKAKEQRADAALGLSVLLALAALGVGLYKYGGVDTGANQLGGYRKQRKSSRKRTKRNRKKCYSIFS